MSGLSRDAPGAEPASAAPRAGPRRGGLLVPAVGTATVLAALLLWTVATRAGWVKPLFLPPPEAVLSAFGQAWRGEIDGAPLGVHTRDSLLRVLGGFTLAALAGGAVSAISVESSEPALAAERANLVLNGMDPSRLEQRQGNAFGLLRALGAEGARFGMIVLDPPKFAPTPKDAERAARGYKDINLHAMRLLEPGGWLATFSCSGGIATDLFQKIVAGAASDAGVPLSIVSRLQAAADHPVSMDFPEGEYLKGLLLHRPR